MPIPTKTFPSPTMAFTNPPTERKRTSYTDSSSSSRPTGSAPSARNPAMSIHFLLNAPGSSRPPPPAPPAYRGRDPSSFVPAAPAPTSHKSRKSSATPSRAVPSSRIGSGHGPPAETFVCDLCLKVFKERGNLTKHKKFLHSSEPRAFVCPEPNCGSRFTFRDGLARHHSTVHQNVREHACPVYGCGKRFKQRSHAVKHVSSCHDPSERHA